MSIETATAPATVTFGSKVRWTVIDGWTLTQRSLDHWRRNPTPLVFSLVFSILIVLMFAYLFGGAMQVPGGGEYRDYLVPGMLAMTMLFGISQTTISMTADVERGVTDRFRSMPTAPSAMLIGRAAADLLFSVVTLIVMVFVGLAIGWRPNGSVADWVTAFGLILLFRFALIWIGVFIGLKLSSQEAVTGVQTLEFPIGFLSSAFVSPATMPGWLGVLAEWNPLSSTVTASRQLFGSPGGGGDAWIIENAQTMAVVWPLIILAVFFPLSVRAYRNLGR